MGAVRGRSDDLLVGAVEGSATTPVLHGPAVVVRPYLPLALWALRRLVTLQQQRDEEGARG